MGSLYAQTDTVAADVCNRYCVARDLQTADEISYAVLADLSGTSCGGVQPENCSEVVSVEHLWPGSYGEGFASDCFQVVRPQMPENMRQSNNYVYGQPGEGKACSRVAAGATYFLLLATIGFTVALVAKVA